jgi:hypothetical protein
MRMIKEKGIANPGRGKAVGKAIVMQGKKPKTQTYPTMNMAQGLPKDGYNRTTAPLAGPRVKRARKADRALRKLEPQKKVKHDRLI